jgi:hypothetical protein
LCAGRAASASSRRVPEHVLPAERCTPRKRSRRVFLVLLEVAAQHARGEHERARAVELRRFRRPCRFFQPLQGLRPEDPEPPRIRAVVVRRPARELEQLVQRLRRHGLRPEGLMGPSGANQLCKCGHATDTSVGRFEPSRPVGQTSCG